VTETAAPTVTIGCRVVNGIALRLCKPGYDDGTGTHPVRPYGPTVTLRGPGGVGDGVNRSPAGGAVMNHGIDRQFITAWLEQHRLDPIVRDGFIFLADLP
jgi:hypothetical protein